MLKLSVLLSLKSHCNSIAVLLNGEGVGSEAASNEEQWQHCLATHENCCRRCLYYTVAREPEWEEESLYCAEGSSAGRQ